MKPRLSLIFFILTGSVIQFFLSGCAYKLSTNLESLPGKVKSIQVPLFKNKSTEPGAEIFFTNSLKSEALKSRVVRLEDDEDRSEAILQGVIADIDVTSAESVVEAKNTQYLPLENVLSTSYTVTVTVELTLKKKGSSTVLWSGSFRQGKIYSSPQITLPVINTANNLYNYSAKRQTLDAISKELMQAAFDRMLENF